MSKNNLERLALQNPEVVEEYIAQEEQQEKRHRSASSYLPRAPRGKYDRDKKSPKNNKEQRRW